MTLRVARKKLSCDLWRKLSLEKGDSFISPHTHHFYNETSDFQEKKRLGKNDAAKMVFFSLLANVAEGKFLQQIGGAKEGELFVLLFIPLDYEYLFWKYRLTRLKNEVIVREKSRFLCAVLSYSATQVKGLQARLFPQKTREKREQSTRSSFCHRSFAWKTFTRKRDVGASFSSSSKWHIYFYLIQKNLQ